VIKKVLITGSSGFIGSAVVNRLKKDGITSIGIDLALPPAEAMPDKFHNVDIRDASAINRVIKSSDAHAVIHLAATHDLSDITNEKTGLTAYRTNTEGTKNILHAIEQLPTVKRGIFTSTQLISELGHQVVSLDDARPSTFYGKSKLIGEKMICSFNKKPYVWMIVRPTTIWGPGMMQHYVRFIKYIEKGWYFHLTNKPLFKSYGYIENVAYQYVRLLMAESKNVDKKTFYLADYEPISLRQYADEIGTCLGAPPIKTLPLFAFKSMAFIGDMLTKTGLPRFPFTSQRAKNILTEYRYDLQETKRLCGKLPVNFKEGIAKTIKWYKKQKPIGYRGSEKIKKNK